MTDFNNNIRVYLPLSHPTLANKFIGCLAVLTLVALFIPTIFAAENSYKLGVDDVISIVVYAGGEKQVDAELTISDDGSITVPMAGSVKAKGTTLLQLEQAIKIPLAQDYFVNPQVIVKVKEYHSLIFSISGAVEKPGQYEMGHEPDLMQLISQAGGLKSEYGHIAYITHKKIENENDEIVPLPGNPEVVEVDLLLLVDSGGTKGNIRLTNGDIVQIPFKTEIDQAKTNIFIEGEIKNPGMYPYRPGLTILNACVMAGGFTEFSAPNRTKIIRKKGQKKKVIKVNLEKIKNGSAKDILLQPGDFINIPETWL